MTINIPILQNIQKFLERVTPSGLESYAWCEAHSAVVLEIKRLQTEESNAKIDAAVKAAIEEKQPKE